MTHNDSKLLFVVQINYPYSDKFVLYQGISVEIKYFYCNTFHKLISQVHTSNANSIDVENIKRKKTTFFSDINNDT